MTRIERWAVDNNLIPEALNGQALDPLWNEHRNPACHWYVQVSRDQYCNIYICQCMQLLHDGMAETILSTE